MKRATRPSILSAPAWRAALKQNQTAGLSRSATVRREADGGVSFVASTAGSDRYGDTIDQTGWDTSAYEKNPVLLWAHSYSTPPVGKVGRIDKSGDLTALDVEFTPKEMHQFGAEVGEMVRAGFLNTVSVGFLPKQWEERHDEAGNFLGYNFKAQELLEISVVPVPANPQALVDGRAFAKSIATWADSVTGDAPPLAREYRDTLAAWLKSAEEQAQRTADAQDADAFAEMLAVLRSIDGRLATLERAAGAPLVREAPVSDAPRKPRTLSEALTHLLTPSR